MSQTAVELQTLPPAFAEPGSVTPPAESDLLEDQAERTAIALPPVDHGKDAWLFLAACFTLEALVWGFPFSFGVFQDYYSTHEPFEGSPNLAIIGTCAMVSSSYAETCRDNTGTEQHE